MGRAKKPVVDSDDVEKVEDKVEEETSSETKQDEQIYPTDPIDVPPVDKPHLANVVNKKSSVEAVIRSINGKELTLCCSPKDDTCHDVKILVAKKPDVFLNSEKTTVAALDNGDTVKLSNGSRDGVGEEFTYKRVDATREAK